MAMIPQPSLFSWQEIENLADFQRLSLLLTHLPDEPLMRRLESQRGRGRNDYPIRALWNSVLAGIVYQHPSIESLRRELMRNAQLRQLCGLDLCKGIGAVPSSNAYTNFLTLLIRHMDGVDALFYDLVDKLRTVLPNFGRPWPLTVKPSVPGLVKPVHKPSPTGVGKRMRTPGSRPIKAHARTAACGNRSKAGLALSCI